MKKRFMAGLLSVLLSLSLVTTSFAAEVPELAAEEAAVQQQEETEAEDQEFSGEAGETADAGDTEPAEETEDSELSFEEEEVPDEIPEETVTAAEEAGEVTEEEPEEEDKEEPAEEEEIRTQAETGEWTSEDFIYTEMSQKMNGCDYTREFTIQGIAIAGFSESGAEKIKTNKDLVIPAKDPNGTTIVGIADSAFRKQGIQSLILPEGMMVDYNDTVTHVVTRRGNFLIGSGAFDGNEITSLVLPEGVIFIGPSSFARNNISYLKIPHTFWWLENSAFAYNNLSSVDFPQTCDFQAQIHAFAFAHNNIKSVRLPDYMEVVEKKVFYWNPGMEPCSTDAPENEQGFGGVVYMYTDNAALFDMERIHHMDRTAESQHSWHQKLILGDNPEAEKSWTAEDFTYSKSEDGKIAITGLSETGIKKRAEDRNLILPDKNPDGEWVTEIAATTNGNGTFATASEGFDSVVLPSRLEKIGNRAFADNGLQSVEFPGTLKEIGVAAFQMNRLSTIILPDSVTTLGGGAFGSNPTIRTVILSKGLTEISAGAFGCSDAQNYMTEFTEIVIPENITKIGNNAFAGNNFRQIVIPSKVTSIGNYAFSTKEYLTDEATLVLPEGLETIGTYAFRNKTIKEVVLPSTVKALKANTFAKVYSSGEQAVKTKVYVSTEAQYKDKKNFPASEFHRLVLRIPGMENQWNAEDFTYGTIEATLYPAHDTKDTHVIRGTGITGLSEEGVKKLEVNTDLVIPEEDYDGNQIIGIGASAFNKKGLTSVTFPKGVMTDYSGSAIADGVTKRGNFIILASAFLGNQLTELELPEGVIYVGNNAFKSNKLKTVSMSHTIWWIGQQAFATNEISMVDFPETCDFKLNIDNMAFGQNQIKAVRLPDRTEKITNAVFFQNTGMEPVSDSAPNANYKKGGVVYMYNETVDLTKEGFVTHTGGTGTGVGVSGTKSWVQKFVFGEMPAELRPWGSVHFTFDGTTITGLSEGGRKKLSDGGTEIPLPTVNSEGNAVTAIGNNAFAAQGSITKVVIPDTVKSIGTAAFRATGLTEVVLPDSVETLGSGAFTNCTSLSSVTLSKNLKEITQSAFNFTSIKEVVIPEGVETIGRMAFRNTPVTSLTLPSTVKKIDRQAFDGNQLTEITIPGSVESIEQSAFSQDVEGEGLAPRLTKLTLNEGLKTIGKSAFNKSLLTNVNIPSTLEKLDGTAFTGGQKGQVKLFTSNKAHMETTDGFAAESDSHKVIFDQVVGSGWSHDDFTYDGSKITGWSEQGHKTRLSDQVLAQAPVVARVFMRAAADAGAAASAGIRTLVIPSMNPDTLEPITEIGDSAFKIPDGEWEQGKDSVTSPNGMDAVIFPDTLTVIGANAFQYNKIKELDFPASLTTVRTSAFNSNRLGSLVLPDTITEVQSGAFSTNDITSLTLSKGLTKIESGTFSMNIRLSYVEIPDTVTEIGDMAFAGARLETLEIPKSVTKIGRKAFHLHHLTELTIPGNVKEIGESAFEGTFKAITLKKLVLEEGIETIGKNAFKEGYLESVQLPYSLKSLSPDAFTGNAGTDNDHKVVLHTSNPTHMKFTADDCQTYVFTASWLADCFEYSGATVTGFSEKGLSFLEYTKEVRLPDKNAQGQDVTAIGKEAFKGHGLTQVTMPAKLAVIGEGAFIGNALTEVTLPDTVKKVDGDVFDKEVDVKGMPKDESKPDPKPDPGTNPGNNGNNTGNSGNNGNNTGNSGNSSNSGSNNAGGAGNNGGAGSGNAAGTAATGSSVVYRVVETVRNTVTETTARNNTQTTGTTNNTTDRTRAADTAKAVGTSESLNGAADISDNLQEVGDAETPLANNAVGGWSLINLMTMLLSAVLGVLTMLMQNAKSSGRKDRRMKAGGVIIGMASCLVFALTENMAQPMVIADRWTALMLVLAVMNVCVLVVEYVTSSRECA